VILNDCLLDDFYDELHHSNTFVNDDEIHEPIAGPSRHGPTGFLEDEDDERVEVIHSTAGKVIRMEKTIHERWRNHFGVQNENVEEEETGAFHPFESKLDWEIACWAIEEGIGHGALDRLLAIPGVSLIQALLLDSN